MKIYFLFLLPALLSHIGAINSYPCEKNKDETQTISPQSRFLHFYVLTNDLCTVNEILSLGGNPDMMSPYGGRPLHICAEQGRYAMGQLLLRHGADYHKKDLLGNTPLHTAVRCEQKYLVRLLGNESRYHTLKQYHYRLSRMAEKEKIYLPACVVQLIFQHAGNPICEIKNKAGDCCLDERLFFPARLFSSQIKKMIKHIHALEMV